MPYVSNSYWSSLHERGDMSAVGQSGLPAEMNRWLYRIQARNLQQFLVRNGVDRIRGKAFDVGAGRGFWTEAWLRAGADRVDGCDLVPLAVAELNASHGATGEFLVADIGQPDQFPGREYAWVSCMNVLLHVTDDGLFDNALRNLAGLVGVGGRLVLAEPILFDPRFERAPDPNLSSRARSLARYCGGLEQCGLTLVDVVPATVVANNPIEAGTRAGLLAWKAAWAAIGLPAKVLPVTAGIIGPLLAAVDPLLLKTGAAPSGKYALFERRPRQQAQGSR